MCAAQAGDGALAACGVRAGGWKGVIGTGTGDILADYWIDVRNAAICELHATRLASRASERATGAWFGTRLVSMDVMTHPMFDTGTPRIADWASQVDIIMRLKNKIRTAGLYVATLVAWNRMNTSADADIDAISEHLDGVYVEGFLQETNVRSQGSLQIQRLRRCHADGRGCLRYLQPRRGDQVYRSGLRRRFPADSCARRRVQLAERWDPRGLQWAALFRVHTRRGRRTCTRRTRLLVRSCTGRWKSTNRPSTSRMLPRWAQCHWAPALASTSTARTMKCRQFVLLKCTAHWRGLCSEDEAPD